MTVLVTLSNPRTGERKDGTMTVCLKFRGNEWKYIRENMSMWNENGMCGSLGNLQSFWDRSATGTENQLALVCSSFPRKKPIRSPVPLIV